MLQERAKKVRRRRIILDSDDETDAGPSFRDPADPIENVSSSSSSLNDSSSEDGTTKEGLSTRHIDQQQVIDLTCSLAFERADVSGCTWHTAGTKSCQEVLHSSDHNNT